MQGNGCRLVFGGFFHGLADGKISGIALRGRSEIDSSLGEGDPGLRHADAVHHLETGIGQQKGIGIGQADVLGRQNTEPARDEERILAPVQHPRHPVDRRIGIRPADALDEGRNDVVVHLAALVVDGDILLQTLRDRAVVDDDRIGLAELRVHHDLQDIQQLTRVAAAVAEQRVRLLDLDPALLEDLVLVQRPVQQPLQVRDLQRLQHEDLAARQQRRDHLEGRILRGGADQDDGTGLDSPQEGILLGLVEAVDLVDEEDGRAGRGEERLGLGRVDHLAHVLDARAHGRKRIELPVQRPGDDARKGGLADARRPPEDKGRQSARVHHVPQDASRTDQMLLTDVVGQLLGPHPLRKRR